MVKHFLSKGRLAVIIIIAVLVIDQMVKICVKTTMYYHESYHITDWFQIYFTENRGMAFGMEIIGKLFLTSFRIIAVILISWYLINSVKRRLKTGYIVCVSLILAGAIGNIIDSVFYGVIFEESTNSHIASLVPVGQGYGSWFQGKVVDMFYFPIIDTSWPDWLPIWGGEHFIFFSPIFNVADSSITCGIFVLLIFYHKYWSTAFKDGKK
ncbi:signal peptidase II [Bacteroidetes bacterium oral taxon 272 str. F0290]|nr:signal peptidase II [Bacteroidetes bacterium oral taxon 272 str. F0290]